MLKVSKIGKFALLITNWKRLSNFSSTEQGDFMLQSYNKKHISIIIKDSPIYISFSYLSPLLSRLNTGR